MLVTATTIAVAILLISPGTRLDPRLVALDISLYLAMRWLKSSGPDPSLTGVCAMTDWTLPESPEDDPILGDDDYPHDIELQRIGAWPYETPADLVALMDYVKKRWSYPQYWEEEDVFDLSWQRQYTISTGGWSGNESLIAALRENLMFNVLAPWSWRRGGHYVYRIPLEVPDGNQDQA